MKKLLSVLIIFSIMCSACVSANSFKYGDADGDNVISANDAALVLQKILNSETTMPIENTVEDYLNVVDVNSDNKLNSEDCAMILQKALDNSYTLPCENSQNDNSLNIVIEVNGRSFNATLYDNAAARELISQLPLSLNMEELNGNEKYYYMDTTFSAESESVGYINTGDLMLYGSDCLVLFYESFNTSYRYTPLGRIDNPQGLAEALGNGNVVVNFSR